MRNQPCTCTFDPCCCEAISRLTPDQREQAQAYYLRAHLAKRRRADFQIRKEARTRPVERIIIEPAKVPPRPLSGNYDAHPRIQKSHEAMRRPCEHCGVNDGQVEWCGGYVLHRAVCRAAFFRSRRLRQSADATP